MNERNQMSLADLFSSTLVIPTIQRDYCMGSFIKDKNKLLEHIVSKFYEDKNKELVLSAVTIYEKADKKILYDGQQRVVTLFLLSKWLLGNQFESLNWKIEFEKRPTINNFIYEKATDNTNQTYAVYSAKALEAAFHQTLRYIDKNEFLHYILKRVVFDRVVVSGELSTAEQFFIDINSGVPIVPYELFKCLLNDKVDQFRNENLIEQETAELWFSKVDNDWLDLFGSFRKVQLDDESAKEELMEMRFIEYCIRMICWEKEICNPLSTGSLGKKVLHLKSFTSSDLKDARLFIDCLEAKDIKRMISIMNKLEKALQSKHLTGQGGSTLIAKVEDYNAAKDETRWIGTLYFNLMAEDFSYISSFIKALELDALNSDRKKDMLLWAILEYPEKVRDVKNLWNQMVIKEDVAYITPTRVYTCNEFVYPVPLYYLNLLNCGIQQFDDIYTIAVDKMKLVTAEDFNPENELDKIVAHLLYGGDTKIPDKDLNEIQNEDYISHLGETINRTLDGHRCYKIIYKRTINKRTKSQHEILSNTEKFFIAKLRDIRNDKQIFLIDADKTLYYCNQANAKNFRLDLLKKVINIKYCEYGHVKFYISKLVFVDTNADFYLEFSNFI